MEILHLNFDIKEVYSKRQIFIDTNRPDAPSDRESRGCDDRQRRRQTCTWDELCNRAGCDRACRASGLLRDAHAPGRENVGMSGPCSDDGGSAPL